MHTPESANPSTSGELEFRHSAEVGEARSALEAIGLVVDDGYRLDDPTGRECDYLSDPRDNQRPAPRLTRLTVDAGLGGVGYVTVATREGEAATIHESSLHAGLGGFANTRVVTIVLLTRSGVLGPDTTWRSEGFASPTNSEVRYVRELRAGLARAASDALDQARGYLGDRVLTAVYYPESATRSEVLVATDLLEEVGAGASVEWALRRYEGDS